MIFVLLLDDELAACQTIRPALSAHGIAIEGHADADGFCAAARAKRDCVALIDWNLRKCEGTEIVMARRREGDTRRIALISGLLDREHGRELAARCGADDFIEKPGSVAEWAEQIHTLAKLPPRLPSGTFRLDPRTNASAMELREGWIILHDHRIELRDMEYLFLQFLLGHAGEEVSFDQLLEHVWQVLPGRRSPEKERLLRGRVITTVKRLREALGSAAKIIETVDGGYRIELAPYLPPPVT